MTDKLLVARILIDDRGNAVVCAARNLKEFGHPESRATIRNDQRSAGKRPAVLGALLGQVPNRLGDMKLTVRNVRQRCNCEPGNKGAVEISRISG
jgi:hypothetical protein